MDQLIHGVPNIVDEGHTRCTSTLHRSNIPGCEPKGQNVHVEYKNYIAKELLSDMRHAVRLVLLTKENNSHHDKWAPHLVEIRQNRRDRDGYGAAIAARETE